MTITESLPLPTKTELLWRGIRGRCPCCGQGALFSAYLQQNASCAECGTDLSPFRAEDGPAWVIILLTGHVVVPYAVHTARQPVEPDLWDLLWLMSLTIALVLVLLPRAKGAFIAVLWYLAKKRQNP